MFFKNKDIKISKIFNPNRNPKRYGGIALLYRGSMIPWVINPLT